MKSYQLVKHLSGLKIILYKSSEFPIMNYVGGGWLVCAYSRSGVQLLYLITIPIL